MYLKKFFNNKRICILFINIVLFLMMYNINLYATDVPWERDTFRWLIHEYRWYNRIYLYEAIAILASVAGYLYLSGMLTTFSWLIIIFADIVGYIPGNYNSANYSPDINYGPMIYVLGMILVFLLGCFVEILLYKIKNKKVEPQKLNY